MDFFREFVMMPEFDRQWKSGSGQVAYAKSDKDILSAEERKEIANMIAILKRSMDKQESRR